MSTECKGVNYALRLHQGVVEIRATFFQKRTSSVEIEKIRSIELLRKSVMPPVVIGGVSLAIGLVVDSPWLMIVPPEFRVFLGTLGLGIAALCLILLIFRWFFANLVLRRSDAPPVIVRMVPAPSARRFFALLQSQASVSQNAQMGMSPS